MKAQHSVYPQHNAGKKGYAELSPCCLTLSSEVGRMRETRSYWRLSRAHTASRRPWRNRDRTTKPNSKKLCLDLAELLRRNGFHWFS